MKVDKFYVAYGYRTWAMYDLIEGFPYPTYEEAEKAADNMLVDDDDARVWINVDGEWYMVWGRDEATGNLIVTKDTINWMEHYVSEWR